MRYHEVIRWYGIVLSPRDEELADIFFSAGTHHFHRWRESSNHGPASFHRTRYEAHLRALKLLVAERGDFTDANDPSERGLHEPDGWHPDLNEGPPDPAMFEGLLPDPQYPLCLPHPLDLHLPSAALNRPATGSS